MSSRYAAENTCSSVFTIATSSSARGARATPSCGLAAIIGISRPIHHVSIRLRTLHLGQKIREVILTHTRPLVERRVWAVPSNHHASRAPTHIHSQAARIPARHHGVHLSCLSRHAALAPHVHTHRHSHRGHLRL